MFNRLLVLMLVFAAGHAHAQMRYQEGVHYFKVDGGQTVGVPAGKIEVAEVFSYVCGACFQASGPVSELKGKLPSDAQLTYVHAGVNTGWPVFQQAYLTAQQLGIVDATHKSVFDGVWTNGKIAWLDPKTGGVRNPMPAIRDLARFYASTGATTESQFMTKANSPEVKAAITRSESLMRTWKVGSTPVFVINGRYRIDNQKLASWDELAVLVNYLVGLERSRLRKK
jgi:thiol:disulfide interchange protein DsbA